MSTFVSESIQPRDVKALVKASILLTLSFPSCRYFNVWKTGVLSLEEVSLSSLSFDGFFGGIASIEKTSDKLRLPRKVEQNDGIVYMSSFPISFAG